MIATISRFFSRRSLPAVIGLVVLGAAATFAGLYRSGKLGPKAKVDHFTYDLGVIESSEKLGHVFTIRNVGDSPLKLARGPKLCSCTITDLPDEPVPPGGEAKVKMDFTPSAKADTLVAGHFSKGIRVLTNDPQYADVLLELTATVSRRVWVERSPLDATIDATKAASKDRTLETWVLSDRWDRFTLTAAAVSRKDIRWRAEPATQEKIKDLKVRSGYHVFVTLPADLPEGRLAEWIDFSAKPAAARDEATRCRLDIQGRVEGRLAIVGPKVLDRNLLVMGSVPQGKRAIETVLVKVHDERCGLSLVRVEAEPAFLRAKLTRYGENTNRIGLYRLEIEAPADAPMCAYLGERAGVVRLHTDHPRLPTIELRVSFAVEAAETAHMP